MIRTLQYWLALRISIALVWFYQGAWLKVIAVDPHHLSIIESAIPFGPSRLWIGFLGAFETMLGIWFLTGWRKKSCAFLQVYLLIGMNTFGIIFAGEQIPDVPGMVLMNVVFLMAVAGAGGLCKTC